MGRFDARESSLFPFDLHSICTQNGSTRSQISAHGHTLLAELAVHYLQTQIQLMSPYDTYNTDEDLLDGVRWVSNLTEGIDSHSPAIHEDRKMEISDVPGVSKRSDTCCVAS